MAKKYIPLITLLVFISSRLIFSQSKIDESRTKYFSKDSFMRHLNFLGNDLFEGRAPGTLGGNLAAKYTALEFDYLKLKPVADNDSYYQNIPFHSFKPLYTSQLKLIVDNNVIDLNLNSDYLLYQSGESTFLIRPVPLVFVGYGISAPEFNYDDYKDIDVEGKIVVMIEGEPISHDPEHLDGDYASYFDGDYPTIYSVPEAKQRIALSKGAKGTIIIPLPRENNTQFWNSQTNIFSFATLMLASTPSTSLDLLFNPDRANLLFSGSNYSLDSIYMFHRNLKMKSFNLSTKLTFKGDFLHRDFVSPNIIGLLEGSDPVLKNSYVIVSAHYDHLGIGPAVNGDSIYNGVFDNAVGVAGLLEIARNFSEKHFTNKRSLLFILTTAEESGLLGSYYYTQNPIVPLYKTIASINIDGIAAFDNFKSIIGVGTEYSTLGMYLEKIAGERKLIIRNIPPEFASFGAYAKSDQHSFAKAGIPSLLISEGLDYVNLRKEEGLNMMINYSTNIYHTPSDDLHQKICYDAVAQHLEVIASMIELLAIDERTPEWLNNSPFVHARNYSVEMKK
jgi:hypothetical protein